MSDAEPASSPEHKPLEIDELRAENALLRVAVVGVFSEITSAGAISQSTFDLLKNLQSTVSAPTNSVYDKLKQYKKIADAAGGVFAYLIQDSIRRRRAIVTLRNALNIPLIEEDADAVEES